MRQAAEAFGRLADVTIKRDGDYHRIDLRLRDDSVAPDTVKHEFANYALGRAAEAR